MENLYLRPATTADCALLWQWANDETVRKNSFQMQDITMVEHKTWFADVLVNPNMLLYILMEGDVPAGQIRLAKSDCWLISYSIASAYRGQGYGRIMLQLAENKLIISGHTGERLLAEVKADNIASQCIFEGLGYKKTDSKHSNAHVYFKDVAHDIYKVDIPKSLRGQ